MPPDLVFISGASSGIGAALLRSVRFEARVIALCRRRVEGVEHLAADLAEPQGWKAAARLFAREIPPFRGERVVFLHCAGTLDPIGFAGEVDATAYRRNVMLNSAAPQLLGDAFLRALRPSRARGHLVLISSGAARSVYPGWSSYGAGKAAVDQWVRVAGAEQDLRGGRCRVLSVAPGVVATPMQEQIRATPAHDFPQLERFVGLHTRRELRTPEEAAEGIWSLLDRNLENGAVVDLREGLRG